MNKKPKLAIDWNSMPIVSGMEGKALSWPELLKIYEDHGYLFYDGSKGRPPVIIDGDVDSVGFYDTSTEEGKKFLEDHLNKVNIEKL